MWRRRCTAMLAALLLALSGSCAWSVERGDESEVKAAVIYNLLLFVEWPAPKTPAGSFRLCVLDDGALTSALRRHAGRAVQGRALEIQRISATPEELDTCVAVMVEAGNPDVLPRLGVLARSRALLVIGEGAGAVNRGAMIGLRTDGGRISFDIDLGAMRKGGLAPSSKILRLARTLVE
ncbi:MAG: YfiR family protein [Rhodocyclaceae bacterium]|nr:MAG: YfiR family protein [Rhodocyclaceae bacterium]